MAETAFGANRGEWKGVVVNRNDPLRSGRVQVRIFGLHDDKVNVTDEHLPWVYPAAGINSASLNHIGVSPTGVMEGSTVQGYFVDKEHQIPVYTGTIARAAIEKPGPGEVKQKGDPSLKTDVAPNARGVQQMNVQGETNLGRDFNTVLGMSNIEKFLNAGGDPNVLFQTPLSNMLKTIGNIPYTNGQGLLQLLMTVDPQNLSGSIQNSLSSMIGLKNLTNPAGILNQMSMLNGSNFSIRNLESLLGQINPENIKQEISNEIMKILSSLFQQQNPFSQGLGSFSECQGKLTMMMEQAKKAF